MSWSMLWAALASAQSNDDAATCDRWAPEAGSSAPLHTICLVGVPSMSDAAKQEIGTWGPEVWAKLHPRALVALPEKSIALTLLPYKSHIPEGERERLILGILEFASPGEHQALFAYAVSEDYDLPLSTVVRHDDVFDEPYDVTKVDKVTVVKAYLKHAAPEAIGWISQRLPIEDAEVHILRALGSEAEVSPVLWRALAPQVLDAYLADTDETDPGRMRHAMLFAALKRRGLPEAEVDRLRPSVSRPPDPSGLARWLERAALIGRSTTTGERRILRQLDRLSHGPDLEKALVAIGDFGPRASGFAPRIVPLLEHRESFVASRAASTLAKLGTDGVDALSQAIRTRCTGDASVDLGPQRCSELIRALGSVPDGGPDVVPLLLEFVSSPIPQVSGGARLALVDRGVPPPGAAASSDSPSRPEPIALPSIEVRLRSGHRAPSDAAVVVGIADYQHLPDVPYADRDADAFYGWLIDVRGVPADRIERPAASREHIEAALARAGASAGPGGTVWVYFAGHGVAHPATRERLLLGDDTRADTTSVASRGLPVERALALAGEGGARPVLVADTCFAGVGRDGTSLSDGLRWAIPVDALSSQTGLQWYAASPGEVAGPLHESKHGAFTYLVVGALRGWADGELDGVRDGTVTALEAKQFVARGLRMLEHRDQQPVWSGPDEEILAEGVKETGPAWPR